MTSLTFIFRVKYYYYFCPSAARQGRQTTMMCRPKSNPNCRLAGILHLRILLAAAPVVVNTTRNTRRREGFPQLSIIRKLEAGFHYFFIFHDYSPYYYY